MTTAIQNAGEKSRLLTKTAAVGVALLLLQIPACQVRNCIAEKALEQQKAKAEVRSKWAGQQATTHPALLVPFLLAISDTDTYSIAKTPCHLAVFNQKKATARTKNL